MRKNSGVIGVEVLIGALIAGLISFFATQNSNLNVKVYELKKQNSQLTKGIVSCNKDKKDISDYIRLFIPDFDDNK